MLFTELFLYFTKYYEDIFKLHLQILDICYLLTEVQVSAPKTGREHHLIIIFLVPLISGFIYCWKSNINSPQVMHENKK